MMSDDLEQYVKSVEQGIVSAMDTTGQEMVASMKQRLEPHIDTGKLVSSIHADTEVKSSEVITDIDIDAHSEDGTWYAEFLEYGTGIYNENGDGRQTPWAWQPKPGSKYYKTDENGNPVWYFTRGMKPAPFIRPSVSEHLADLYYRVERAMQK